MKGFQLLFEVLSNIFAGTYVPFGALLYYNDPYLFQLMNAIAQAISPLNVQEFETFPKLGVSFFGFLRNLFSSSILVVSSLPRDIFFLFIRYCVAGLASDNESIVKYSCSSIDSLATFIYHNHKSCNQICRRLTDCIQSENDFWYLYVLFLAFSV